MQVHRAPINSKKNRARGTQDVTALELRTIEQNAAVAAVPGKGRGVVSRKCLGKGVLVGSMTGIVYTSQKWDNMARADQITGKYGMALGAGRMVDIEVPMSAPGPAVLLEDYNKALGFMFNEPAPGQRVNAMFVQNYMAGGISPRVDVYTCMSIPKGHEINVHYGDCYKSNRDYPDPADPQPPGVHIIASPEGTPMWKFEA